MARITRRGIPLVGEAKGGDRVDEIVRWVIADWELAYQAREELEDRWTDYWQLFLSEKRKVAPRGRSNSVGPHGGMTIRVLVPAIKRSILSTRPFIRPVARKKELVPFEPHLEQQMDVWIDGARVRTIVLTHGLKEALVMGSCWFKVDHEVVTREIGFTTEQIQAMEAEGIEVPDEPVEEIVYEGPRVHFIPSENCFPYPNARDLTDLERSGYFAHRFFKTKSELMEDEKYDQDKVEELTTPNAQGQRVKPIPMERLFEEQRRRVLKLNLAQMARDRSMLQERDDDIVEVIEYIAGGQLIAVGNRTQKIRETALDHPMPVFSVTPDPIPGEIWGKSIYHDALQSIDQRDFVANNIYDNLAQLVHLRWKGVPHMYDPGSLISGPGRVARVSDMNALEPIDLPNVLAPAFPVLTSLDRDIERGTGVSEIMSTIGAGSGTVYPETATVGSLKQENALLFVGEMVSNIENEGLHRMAKIFFDNEREYLAAEHWIRLMGEEGARYRDVDPDTLVANIDWQVVGSSYAANRQAQAEAVTAAFDRMLAIQTRDPSAIDLRELGLTFLDAWGVPNKDKIVKGRPPDVGPEAEHEVMRQGLPVEPEETEDLQRHMMTHLAELQRAMTNPEEDPGFVQRMIEHVQKTRDLITRIQAALQMIREQQATQTGGGNGEIRQPAGPGPAPPEAAGAGPDQTTA